MAQISRDTFVRLKDVLNVPKIYEVVLIEYERGWGSRIDDRIYFDNIVEAKEYVERFNARNTEKIVPDWYMIAEFRGVVNLAE